MIWLWVGLYVLWLAGVILCGRRFPYEDEGEITFTCFSGLWVTLLAAAALWMFWKIVLIFALAVGAFIGLVKFVAWAIKVPIKR